MSGSNSRSATSSKGGAVLSAGSKKIVNCPQCGAPVAWEPANRYRPFCSERCKMIDLGAWATEAYRIPVAEERDTPDDPPDTPARD